MRAPFLTRGGISRELRRRFPSEQKKGVKKKNMSYFQKWPEGVFPWEKGNTPLDQPPRLRFKISRPGGLGLAFPGGLASPTRVAPRAPPTKLVPNGWQRWQWVKANKNAIRNMWS